MTSQQCAARAQSTLPRRFAADRHGVTSIEFAIVLPLLLAMVLLGIGFSVAIWKSNIVQELAQESARCAVSATSECSVFAPSCAPSFDPKCYVPVVARARSVREVEATAVAVNKAEAIGSASFTTVRINYSMDVFGFTLRINGIGAYPN